MCLSQGGGLAPAVPKRTRGGGRQIRRDRSGDAVQPDDADAAVVAGQARRRVHVRQTLPQQATERVAFAWRFHVPLSLRGGAAPPPAGATHHATHSAHVVQPSPSA